MDSLNIIFLIGSLLFFTSFLILLLVSIMRIKPYRKLYTVMLLIPLIAGISYYLMYRNIGILVQDGEIINATRYVEWAITTPILLYILTNLMIAKGSSRNLTIFKLILLDITMIATGFMAEIADGLAARLWFAVSGFAYLAIIYIIVESLSSADRVLEDKRARKIVIQLAWVVLVLWSFYPLVWILGIHGIGIIDIITENKIYLVMDLMAKVGFASLLLVYLHTSNRLRTAK